MLKTLKIISFAALALSGFFIIGASINTTSENNKSEISIPYVDPGKDYWLAGERVPVENFDVLERFERELLVNTFRHSVTIMNLKKSSRYFPVIEPILKEQGIPDDFKYLAVAESDLQHATSPAGAKGIWQFMKGTAGDYGLEVSDDVDERYHVEKATIAACEHIRRLKNRFGSWALVMAAYNMGASGLAREMEYQRINNFYGLNLNDETNRYVFRVLAFKEVMTFPEKYGFEIPKGQHYKTLSNYNVALVDTTITNLGDFANQFGTSYRLLKVYNPWLRNRSLAKTDGKTYEIRIPKGG